MSAPTTRTTPGSGAWLVRLTRAPRAWALAIAVVTALLAVPLVAMQPTSTASPEPDGEVFDARDAVNERFEIAEFPIFVIIEAEPVTGDATGPGAELDMLAPDRLRQLAAAQDAARADAEVGDLLLTTFDREADVKVDGVFTVADAVERALAERGTSLADADDRLVRETTTAVIDEQGPAALGLSVQGEKGEDGFWHAPAVTARAYADNQALGGGGLEVVIGTEDLSKEEYARDLVAVLDESSEGYSAVGVAIDANLTGEEEGQAAGPFIGMTVLGVLLICGLVFRSYWAVTVIAAGIATLIVWLRGFSNLVGLENDQVLDTIVPIALISFGIDFAFHAVGRYREHVAAGRARVAAVGVGLAGVMGALTLALVSDAVAFLANAASGIESIVQFGVASAIGLAAAFVLLGVAAPILIAHLEDRFGARPATRSGRVAALVGSVGSVLTATSAVLVTVYVYPAGGVVLLGVLALAFLLLPAGLLAWRRSRRGARASSESAAAAVPSRPGAHRAQPGEQPSRAARGIGALTAQLARRALVVVPAALVVTAIMASFAVRIPTEFDVKDYFSDDTNFVIALERLDEHVAETGGEPGNVLLTGDLDTVAAMRALVDFRADLDGIESEVIGREDDGSVQLEPGALGIVQATMSSPPAREGVRDETGVAVTDRGGDGLPDTDEQVRAVLRSAEERGVALPDGTRAYTPAAVGERLDLTRGRLDATVLTLSFPGSRAVENVRLAQDQLEAPLADLAEATPGDGKALLTGSPFVRQGQLDAVSDALVLSLPIALVACLAIAAAWMRSVRLGVISVIPILLVVPWLYGLMELTGFAINLVTGTIGAISIGIGIDFAIHFVARYRDELAALGDRLAAMRAAGEGTGLALAASAGSSVLGFLFLSFAPMPLFASYGLLTAIMIAMALVATMVVLPPLLYLVTRDHAGGGSGSSPADSGEARCDDDLVGAPA